MKCERLVCCQIIYQANRASRTSAKCCSSMCTQIILNVFSPSRATGARQRKDHHPSEKPDQKEHKMTQSGFIQSLRRAASSKHKNFKKVSAWNSCAFTLNSRKKNRTLRRDSKAFYESPWECFLLIENKRKN